MASFLGCIGENGIEHTVYRRVTMALKKNGYRSGDILTAGKKNGELSDPTGTVDLTFIARGTNRLKKALDKKNINVMFRRLN